MELGQEHRNLIAMTKSSLRKRNWDFLRPEDLGSFPTGIDLLVYRPIDGPIGIICHARRNTDLYCMRKPQVELYSSWYTKVYVVFDNGKVTTTENFRDNGIPLPGLSAGHEPYYQLINDDSFMPFNEVFK